MKRRSLKRCGQINAVPLSLGKILEGVERHESDAGRPTIPEATLEWLRLFTKGKEVPLIFYERGQTDGSTPTLIGNGPTVRPSLLRRSRNGFAPR